MDKVVRYRTAGDRGKKFNDYKVLTFEHVFNEDAVLNKFPVNDKLFVIGTDQEDHCNPEEAQSGKVNKRDVGRTAEWKWPFREAMGPLRGILTFRALVRVVSDPAVFILKQIPTVGRRTSQSWAIESYGELLHLHESILDEASRVLLLM